ncbi:MAG: hypothetical protein K0S09_3224 [Sphingobacteriaceae bacterium]|jgi:outer membrane receptor protein involved in Fe transport|nr:hypothetical protein [Sphingobacteriaceae bacterium]
MKIFRLLFISFSLVLATNTLSKAQGTISGIITDKSNKSPLEAATVTLKSRPENAVVKQLSSGALGKFSFSNIQFGTYTVDVASVGFLNYASGSVTVDERHPLVTLSVSLTSDQKKLKEVVVSAKKPLFTNSIDRKVYNVEQDVMSKSGTASDVLQNVPLVQVDIDGNVSLRNSSVTILINGKKNPLMGKNAAAVLQQLPANSIERIEVITNPSARCKPDGQGGIINIVLKKNTRLGLNGNVTANAGNAGRYNASMFLNYNPKKFNVFGSYSLRQDDRLRLSTSLRNQSQPSGIFSDTLTDLSRPFSNIASAGVDFNPSEKTSFGLSGNYYSRSMHKHDNTGKFVQSATDIENYDRRLENHETESESDATAYFEHNFKKEDHLIRLELNTTHSPEVEDNRFTNQYHFPVRGDSLDNTLIRQVQDENQVMLSYENPINDDTQLELGYEGDFNRQDLDFYGEEYKPAAGRFVTDPVKTNRFIYDENIHSLYGTLTHSFGEFGFEGGLRAEYSDIRSRLINTGGTIPSQYFKIYPTLHLSYDLSKLTQLQLNYSRRVRRPEGDDLNPFAEYRDPTNIRVGNPYLKPELTHSVELGYQWKKDNLTILPSIYYRYKYNGFTSISRPSPSNSSILITSQENLSNDQSVGADLVLSGSITKKVTSNFSTNVFYNQIDASSLGYSDKRSTVTWSANLNSVFTLSSSTMMQVNSNYRSARLTPQGKNLPSFVMNMGLRQEVLKKKGSIYFTASDIFKSQREEQRFDTPALQLHSKRISNSRIFFVGMGYSFGYQKKKKDSLQFDNGL